MCCSNFNQNIVEELHYHWRYESPEDAAESDQKEKRRLGLRGDVPKWLIYRMQHNPPSKVNRAGRQQHRNRLKVSLQKSLRPGADLEEVNMETRVSRMDRVRSSWW